MPRALTAPGPLDTLEEAFDLLQRAPLSAWLRYLSGAAPLIVGLLFVWNQFSGESAASANPVLASLLLTALLVWFYRCRTLFAAHLRRVLSLTPNAAPLPEPAWSLACFEGTRLLIIPVSVLCLIPLAYATGFYRSLTIFSAQGLPARDAAAKAWKAATAWQRENWLTIGILHLLLIVILANVALTVILTPMLVKILTGYESVLIQRGPATLSIQFPVIAALTWLCYDPLLQAVYAVRVFKWEGLGTGEDLLVRLKTLAPLLLLLALSAAPFRLAADAPPP